MQRRPIVASFVHGYLDMEARVSGTAPAMAVIGNDGEVELLEFFFPRSVSDFNLVNNLRGIPPKSDAYSHLVSVPRLGLTGLAQDTKSGKIVAGSHTGIFVINSDLSQEAFVSHRLLADPHGIALSDDFIFSALPELDLVVKTDLYGDVCSLWQIGGDFRIRNPRNENLPTDDFRMRGKGRRGPMGRFHFNNVEVVDGRIFVTSRNIGAVLSFKEEDQVAELLPVAHHSPVLIHDGVPFDGLSYFTSIDGKILTVDARNYAPDYFYRTGETPTAHYPFAASSAVLRMTDVLGRDVNWMRGLDVTRTNFVTTVDGIYGSSHFSVIDIDRSNTSFREFSISWEMLRPQGELRFATGFDCLDLRDARL